MKTSLWLAGVTWLVSMIWLHAIERSDFYLLWSMYSIAFASYAWLIFKGTTSSLFFGLGLSLLVRMISFFFEPLLSDDYFRFIWDGMLWHEGIHPMAYTPAWIMQHPEIMEANPHLYSLLNSQNYFSVYPPVTQFIFALAFKLCALDIPGQILFYKTVLLCSDVLITFLLYKLLRQKKLPAHRILLFTLNPLIILEFMGNLHMDGLMITGLLGALLVVDKKHVFWGSVMMAFSILSKMLTLILIPFMSKNMYWKNFLFFTLLTCILSAGFFWFSFGGHTGWIQSVGLWFRSFEFNAGVYYLMRGIGYAVVGYNNIETIGPLMALATVTVLGILWLWYIRLSKWNESEVMLYALFSYFLMTTTLHPWYLGLPLVLGILSGHLFPAVWTYLVYLSYSHYQEGRFEENFYLIAAEYLLLTGWMIWEWKKRKSSVS